MSSTFEIHDVRVDRLLSLRQRREIDQLDYLRELRRDIDQGRTQTELARLLSISQAAVSKAVKVAAGVADPAPGFSGAGPYEIAQRYAAGYISRSQLVEELERWPYVSNGQTDGNDSLLPSREGSWDEVSRAAREGLIDDDAYDEILDQVAAEG